MAPSNTESDYPTPSTLDTSAPSTANPQPNGQVAVDFNKDNDKPTTGSSQATTDTMESKAKETVMRERRKEEDETNESEESEETPKKSRRKKKKTKKNQQDMAAICAAEVDEYPMKCPAWRNAGYCESNQATKFLWCRKTCRCSPTPQSEGIRSGQGATHNSYAVGRGFAW
ncbi:unnamed protein product [Nippostrongylus brasiliensis]|uniref:ShKT domain-containing protein n=1 Tax=Nippostrongylus brasiliensis TaxID=27835 RepID=A0A0N4XU22_NIPBR|nr:unnamed protein product [Nippostrongylus brasiliensis]